jgi:hypothetical protein
MKKKTLFIIDNSKRMKNKDKFLIITFCIVVFLYYVLYGYHEKFANLLGTGSVDLDPPNNRYYCNNQNGWHAGYDPNLSLKFKIYDDNSLIPIPNNTPNSCYIKDNASNKLYSFTNGNFRFGDNGKNGASILMDVPTTQAATTTTQPATTTTRAATTTTQAATTTTQPSTTTTRAATTTTQAAATTTTIPFTTTPYNTQYLTNIKKELDTGYSMLNTNRFTIMDNQLRLDNLNTRVNKLLNNINRISKASNQNNNIQSNDITWY